MLQEKEFKEVIKNQFVLLDANILIKAFENTSYFKGFLEFLVNSNCDIVDFDFVNFEFTRNDYKPEIIKLKEEFLNKMNAINFSHSPDLLKKALSIAKVYSHQGIQKGQISLVDCFIGALLKQYGKKLFLATLNHPDFPIALFDREYIFPIDSGNNVLPVAFYRFNEKKWTELEKRLEKVRV